MDEEKVYCSMYSRNAELYHHGIKGQKWGVRNGPPYPLGSDVSTGSRLKKNLENDISQASKITSRKESEYFWEYFKTDIYKELKAKQDKLFNESQKKKLNNLEDELNTIYDEIEDIEYEAATFTEAMDSSKEYEFLIKRYNELEKKYTELDKQIRTLQGDEYWKIQIEINNKHDEYIYEKLKNDKEVQKWNKKADKARKILYNK